MNQEIESVKSNSLNKYGIEIEPWIDDDDNIEQDMSDSE